MIDFPVSPSVGQNFSAAGVTWTWDGAKWSAAGLNQAYVPLAGGTMTGPLTLAGNPVNPLDAVPKQYIDGRIGRNRLINGASAVDQRNANAVVALGAGSGYSCDRWKANATVAGKLQTKATINSYSNLVPSGSFLNVGNIAAYSPAAADTFSIYQPIEWGNVSDCMWGTSLAQPMTLSFWAIASAGGTYSGSICNGGGTRSYPFTFVLPAGAWTFISVTIPPDTTGAWVLTTLNTLGMYVRFDLGCGANFRGPANAWSGNNYIGVTGTAVFVNQAGAGFNITNVQLEMGSQASPFAVRDFGEELLLCQRYFEKSYNYTALAGAVIGVSGPGMVLLYTQFAGITPTAGPAGSCTVNFKVSKRALPTLTIYSPVTGAPSKMADRVASVDVAVSGTYIGESMFNTLGAMSTISSSLNLGFCWTAEADM